MRIQQQPVCTKHKTKSIKSHPLNDFFCTRRFEKPCACIWNDFQKISSFACIFFSFQFFVCTLINFINFIFCSSFYGRFFLEIQRLLQYLIIIDCYKLGGGCFLVRNKHYYLMNYMVFSLVFFWRDVMVKFSGGKVLVNLTIGIWGMRRWSGHH